MGCKGVFVTQTCFRDDHKETDITLCELPNSFACLDSYYRTKKELVVHLADIKTFICIKLVSILQAIALDRMAKLTNVLNILSQGFELFGSQWKINQ